MKSTDEHITEANEDKTIQGIPVTQLKGSQETLIQKRELIVKTLSIVNLDKDKEFAKLSRTKNSIALGDIMYLKFKVQLIHAILQYMQTLGVEEDILKFVSELFDGIEYKSTYTEENPNFCEEPGSLGNVSVCFGDISHLPVVISMRHVLDMVGWNMGKDIAAGKLDIQLALEIQYLSVLLHEFLHVASTRLYHLGDRYIGRIGIHILDEAAQDVGGLENFNEGLTDIIAGKIFQSETFLGKFPGVSKGKYFPGYSKHFPNIYHHIMKAALQDGGTFSETMDHVQRGYFGSLEYVDRIRMNIFDVESITYPKGE